MQQPTKKSKHQETEPLEARCPHCGMKYKFYGGYRPKTCGNFECVRKELHPELY